MYRLPITALGFRSSVFHILYLDLLLFSGAYPQETFYERVPEHLSGSENDVILLPPFDLPAIYLWVGKKCNLTPPRKLLFNLSMTHFLGCSACLWCSKMSLFVSLCVSLCLAPLEYLYSFSILENFCLMSFVPQICWILVSFSSLNLRLSSTLTLFFFYLQSLPR